MRIIRSRRKTIALIIDPDGNLTVRAPIGVSPMLIDRFVRDKSEWIQKNQAVARSRKLKVHQYLPGELFYYLGKGYPLEYREKQEKLLVLERSFMMNVNARQHPAEIFKNWYKAEAKRIFTERTAFLGHKFGLTYNQIRITSARTRWGSCSSKMNLSFSWRLVMAPLASIDYVIIHELIHVEHPNHSKRFWERVRSIEPDYKSHRSWLKQNGNQLML